MIYSLIDHQLPTVLTLCVRALFEGDWSVLKNVRVRVWDLLLLRKILLFYG